MNVSEKTMYLQGECPWINQRLPMRVSQVPIVDTGRYSGGSMQLRLVNEVFVNLHTPKSTLSLHFSDSNERLSLREALPSQLFLEVNTIGETKLTACGTNRQHTDRQELAEGFRIGKRRQLTR